MKLYKVKSKSPASNQTSGTGNGLFPRKHTWAFFILQACLTCIPPQVLRRCPPQSRKLSLWLHPLAPRLSYQSIMKPVRRSISSRCLAPTRRQLASFCVVSMPPPHPPNSDKKITSGHQMPSFSNRNCQTLYQGWWDVLLLWPVRDQESFQSCWEHL